LFNDKLTLFTIVRATFKPHSPVRAAFFVVTTAASGDNVGSQILTTFGFGVNVIKSQLFTFSAAVGTFTTKRFFN